MTMNPLRRWVLGIVKEEMRRQDGANHEYVMSQGRRPFPTSATKSAAVKR